MKRNLPPLKELLGTPEDGTPEEGTSEDVRVQSVDSTTKESCSSTFSIVRHVRIGFREDPMQILLSLSMQILQTEF